MSQHVQVFIITAEIFVPFPFHLRGTLLSFLPFNESWNIIMKRKGRGGRVSWRSSVKITVTRSFYSSFILSFLSYPISLSLFSFCRVCFLFWYAISFSLLSLSPFFTPPCEKIPVKFISSVDKFNFKRDSPALLAVSIMSAK